MSFTIESILSRSPVVDNPPEPGNLDDSFESTEVDILTNDHQKTVQKHSTKQRRYRTTFSSYTLES